MRHTKEICALHADIVALCQGSGLELPQTVMACLMSAMAINRADGKHSHAEMVELLRLMESMNNPEQHLAC